MADMPPMRRIGMSWMLVTGAATVLVWLYAPFKIEGQAPSDFLYEMTPGSVASCLAIVLVSWLGKPVSEGVQGGFDAMLREKSR